MTKKMKKKKKAPSSSQTLFTPFQIYYNCHRNHHNHLLILTYLLPFNSLETGITKSFSPFYFFLRFISIPTYIHTRVTRIYIHIWYYSCGIWTYVMVMLVDEICCNRSSVPHSVPLSIPIFIILLFLFHNNHVLILFYFLKIQ